MIVFERKHWQVLIGVIGALLILGILSYLIMIRPLNVRIDLLTSQSQKTMVNETVSEEPVTISEKQIALLAQKVPLKREEESIILDLEKSALVSDTVLDSIVFQYDGMFTEEVDPNDEETPIEPEADTIDEEVDSVEPIIPITAPDGLQTIIVELSIQSKDYESMLLFIEEMEKLNRIYTIEKFGFTGFSEGEERVGPMEDLLNYSIQLITYYAPDINLMLDSRTSPASDEAEKINPLQDVNEAQEPQASASEDSGTEPNEDDSTGEVIVNEPATEVPAQTPVPEKQSAKSHVVKNGETLFSISMDYYGNRSGESVIMKANNKRFNTVYVGEILRIPSY